MSKRGRTARPNRLFSRISAFFVASLIAAWPAFAGIPCASAGAPQCAGDCPAGQRCIQTDSFELTIIGSFVCSATEPLHQGGAAGNAGCECVEVACGGVPLGQDQGCCNGRPFALGTQGCCHGVILDSTDSCSCGEMDIDLATTGCCGEGDSDQQFDPALASCCQQPVAEEGCTGSVATTATFNLGFDCCAGPGADAGVFCDGQCRGSQCATTGCCQCEGCIGDGPVCAAGGPSTIEGLAIGCIVGCFAQVCTDFDSFVNQPAELCSEDGLCLAATTATPAASHGGLLLITALLAGAGFLGLAARRRTGRRLT